MKNSEHTPSGSLAESAATVSLPAGQQATALPAFAVSDEQNFYDEPNASYEDTKQEKIQPPFPQKNARELNRLPRNFFSSENTPHKAAGFFNISLIAKLSAVALVFFLSVFLGLLAAGFMRENSEAVIREREYRRQVLDEQQRSINEQTAALEQEKKRLELENELLAARKKSIEREESRLIGKHEQLYAEESANAESFIGSLIDKVTGRDRERREAMAQTARDKQAASQNGDDVDKALQDAQKTLDDVNEKLAAAREMKKDIDDVRDQIEAAYAQNKDTIDKVAYYTRSGATALMEIFEQTSNDKKTYDEEMP